MRGTLGFPGFLTLAFIVTSVACGGNAPLPNPGTSGGAGMHPAAGSAGHGGSAPPASGAAGATLTGIAGAAGPGVAGAVGMAGSFGVGVAGGFGVAGGVGMAGAIGTAGVIGTAGSPVNSTGGGGTSGILMCGSPTQPTGFCVPGAYKRNGVCACQDGAPCVCPGVGCIDPMHDPDNCGVCGIKCGPSSTCNGGVCGPAPVMVSPSITGCNAMTIVATDAVYSTDAVHGTVNKAGAIAPLATNEKGATLLQANGTNLFWYDTGTYKIRKMPAAGGAPTDVYTVTAPGADGGPTPDVAGFLVSPDGATIYFSLGTNVYKMPVAGGTPILVAEEAKEGLPAALALNGTTNIVYPATFNGDVDAPLLSANPAICGMDDPQDPGNAIMTTCPRLGRSQGELFPLFIAVMAGHAYWIDGPNVKGELIGPKGTSFDSIAVAQTSKITAAAATADTIYFADWDPTDQTHAFIEKTALAPNSTAVLLARGQYGPISIASDATKVYWATSECAIWSQNR